MDIPERMETELFAALRWGLRRIESPLEAQLTRDNLRLAFFGDMWRADEQDVIPQVRIEDAAPAEPLGGGFGSVAYWSDRLLGAGEGVLRNVLADLNDYLLSAALRKEVNDRVRKACTDSIGSDQVLLIGFSMGSFVGYDLLRQDMADGGTMPIAAFVTCGSPLAMPSLYQRVRASALATSAHNRPTPFPTQLRAWVNIWTEDDPGAAGHQDFATRFPAANDDVRRVQDVETHGRGASVTNPGAAHNASDYLSSRAMASVIHQIAQGLGAIEAP